MRTMGKVAAGAALGVTLGVVGGGCMTEPEPVYTETAVHFNPDGTQTVYRSSITLSEELRQNAARAQRRDDEHAGLGTAADAITRDTGCAGADMWLYDQTYFTGNRLCFIGSGIADLSQYNYLCVSHPPMLPTCTHWDQAVKSYYGGIDTAWFESVAQICGGTSVSHCAQIPVNGQGATLTSCEAANTHYLNLDGACICTSGTNCGGTCVDTSTNTSNCGSCGNVCPTHETCSSGSCVCASPHTLCGGTCADTSTDPNNCGGCGHPCPSGGCSGGVCTCTANQDCAGYQGSVMCGGSGLCETSVSCPYDGAQCGNNGGCCNENGVLVCTDKQYDPANCGSCGSVVHCSQGYCCNTPGIGAHLVDANGCTNPGDFNAGCVDP